MAANPPLIQSFPWLQWNLFCRPSQSTIHTNIVAHIKDSICAYSSGWLVLGRDQTHWFLNTNSLKTKIKLPPVNSDYTTCILTCSPSDNSDDCKVLFMSRDRILYCRPGDRKYKTHKLKDGMYIRDDAMVAVVERKVYYITEKDLAIEGLVMIDCSGSSLQFTKIQIAEPEVDCGEQILLCSHHLVEIDNQLCLVKQWYNTLEEQVCCFLVFRFDLLNKMWERVESIGNFTIFLSSCSRQGVSFCASDPNIKKNSIYFLQQNDEDEYFHVYDLQNHSFSIFAFGL